MPPQRGDRKYDPEKSAASGRFAAPVCKKFTDPIEAGPGVLPGLGCIAHAEGSACDRPSSSIGSE
jgi:hypothetical protein